MKKTKIFIGLSAVALSVFGFIATKANIRFAHPTTGNFITASGGIRASVSNLTAAFDTVQGTKAVVQMKTSGGTNLGTLYTGANPGTHKIYR